MRFAVLLILVIGIDPPLHYIAVYQNHKNMTTIKYDKSTWAIGGGILIGIGIGFFFLQQNPLAFVGSILLGLGLGTRAHFHYFKQEMPIVVV